MDPLRVLLREVLDPDRKHQARGLTVVDPPLLSSPQVHQSVGGRADLQRWQPDGVRGSGGVRCQRVAKDVEKLLPLESIWVIEEFIDLLRRLPDLQRLLFLIAERLVLPGQCSRPTLADRNRCRLRLRLGNDERSRDVEAAELLDLARADLE